MRKTLLATSALIAAGVLSGQAMAEVKLTISGGAKYEIDFVSDDAGSGGTEVDDQSVKEGRSSTQIFFTAENTADNGLTYGYKLDLRPNSTADSSAPNTDESYMYFSGNWGTFHIGQDDNVIDNQVVTGADVLAGAAGFDGSIGTRGSHIGTAKVAPDLATSEGDDSKVAYYSPKFSGFQVAVSYAPEVGGASTRDNIVASAINYSGEFGDVNVSGGVGYLFGDHDADQQDYEGLQAGLNVGFGAFSFGAGYTTDFDSVVSNASTLTPIASTSTASGAETWDFGVAYNYGAGKVSLGYLYSEADDGANGTDNAQVFVVGADYNVAEGLVAYGEFQYSESEDDSAAANADEYEASAFVIGTKLSF
ncbi:porin [Aestuariispira insulae]|uniref:Putative porin n=1 Tax=Aestuariispira insulae TaxID=1461337 RepID=A0A3D9HPD3_9PROT|nr:porin [Aestuariispira insulae]RED51347.1 putative porin [Aestuariispira insulae]